MYKSKMKRFVSILLTAALILGVTSTGFAIEPLVAEAPANVSLLSQVASDAVSTKKVADKTFDQSDVSIQLYTVRELFSTEAGMPAIANPNDVTRDASARITYIQGILKQLYNVGFRNVEPYTNYSLTAVEWQELMAPTGLQISSWHQGASRLADKDTRAAANMAAGKFLSELGIKEVFINYAGYTTQAEADTFLMHAVEFRDAMRTYGIGTGFHTHNHEFQQSVNADGTLDNTKDGLMLTKIMEALDYPGYTAPLELDVHWAARAGRDPVQTIYEFKDRITYLHIKDLSYSKFVLNDTDYSMTNTFLFEEVGDGMLDIPAIIQAGLDIGVKYFVVEQDNNWYLKPDATDATKVLQKDPVASVKASYNYLSGMFGKTAANIANAEPERPAPVILESQLSVQLYTISDQFTPVAGDYEGTKAVLQKVRDIGYKNVELYSFNGLTGKEWERMLAEVGLHVSSIHQRALTNEAEVVTLVDNLKAIGLDAVFIPSAIFATYDDAGTALESIEAFRQRLAKDKIKVNYHMHCWEYLQKVSANGIGGSNDPALGATVASNARIALDEIVASGAKLELDTHWAMRAGRVPQDMIDEYASYTTFLHIKDLGFSWNSTFIFEEIGDGVLDMDAIIQAGNAAGVQYYVVEQDGNFLGGSSLASIEKSYNYIKEHYMPDGAVSKVSLNMETKILKAGETVQLNATYLPVEASNAVVTWVSTNTKVATVSSNGLVTAKADGNATIKVTVGGKNTTMNVVVGAKQVPVTKVDLNKVNLTLKVKETFVLVATISPSNASNTGIIWTTSDEKVATVNANGKVTAVGKGVATITACTKEGGKVATCKVEV